MSEARTEHKEVLYKLTDKNGQTHGGCQWGEGVTHTAPGGGELCTKAWIHAYTDPLLAVLLNPIHGKFDPETMRLWECEGEVGITDHGLKVGCTSLTTIREVPAPQVSLEQRARFGILCAKEVYTESTWTGWADAWLDGSEFSRVEATAPRATARVTATAWAAAAWAVTASEAARAVVVAEAARAAAEAAAWAAEYQDKSIDLIALAHKAVGDVG